MFSRLAGLLALVSALWAAAAAADDLAGLARIDGAASELRDTARGTEVTLALSQPVPWRLFTLDGPTRLVIEFNTAAWTGQVPGTSALVSGIAPAAAPEGWSRVVLALASPAEVETAGLSRQADGSARLGLVLVPTDAATFAASARPAPVAPAPPPGRDRSRPMVVLDPGHGGIDPGAEAGGLNEKTLMLAFARELQERLIRGGLFDVTLTRERDEFVPLDTRISRARAAGADVFLSLHADELPEGAGDASGITVYTLDLEATDEASQRLAERHDKNDLLAGVTLEGQGDEIALVLMDLARADTAPASEALAVNLKAAFRAEDLALVGRPLRSAVFSVLKAADYPAALIELGFLSSEADRARLTDPAWREAAQRAIEAALVTWSLDEAARSGLLRR